MVTKRTPTIDSGGKLLEKFIPDRLADTALNATYGPDAQAASAPVKAAIAAATVAPPGAARMNAAVLSNGIPASMNETGQPVTSFGNTPLTVISGAISHAPVADSPAANIAGYMQSKTKSGGKVKGIWAIVQASATANTGLALVLPTLPWANGSLTSAQVHHVEYPNGNWHTSIWTGTAETPKYLPDAVAGTWNDDKPRLIAVLVNEQDNSVTVRHADGSISQSAAGVIDSTLISEYGIIESYRFVNTAADPAVPIKVLRWGLIDQADVNNLVSLGIPNYRDVGKAITAALPKNPAAMVYRPGTELATAATGSLTDVDATNVKLTAVAPASGSLIVDVEAFVNLTNSATNYLWDISQSPAGGSGTGAQRVHIGTCNERKRCRWILSGLTPGQTYTWTLREMAASGTGGGLKAGSTNGYYLSMSAVPAN